ncbi:TRAP transporter large permease [Solemya velum gill symbiont]|uniref:TRAP transporter large permease protein n=1 Tax=Solemya velum gill symbiont TaxID=2340 RepID=A0A0B0H8J6_SOVGS|nr:TRAP transporter large permease subunit [Solemya velum gill symbiont]KHF25390.1 TRAP-type C4-dicarboxylate transporter DctPQM, subunit M1 [Solemya velum gill symbiont]OOY34314.1 C4-dicarboxylate ABC transporter [Solemya velum gill symbiont]OOY36964.1 C4-dicarboxylate ABC transporter [Solemya velum gill symbiont]OOY40665.1 C4-dicarboxylate ABC transporter [Solemya velum gill symbiont]OOY44457.1 C4-dicarboxylate ABC transporter [Solemya velum gill symbiont]
MSLEQIMVVMMFATFILLLFSGFPVAWVLGGTAVLFAVVGHVMVENFGADLWFSWGSSMQLVPERLWDLVGKETLVALPMFIFMGIMLDRSGVAEELMKNIVKLFGGIRGGYAVTVVFIGVLLAASTGIIGASVVLLGMLSLPVMMQSNYNKSLAVGTACSVGTLGILIPPSIMLVLMADRLANPNASVGDLFMGALFPGFLLVFLYVGYIMVYAWVKPNAAPVPDNVEKITLKIVFNAVKAIIPTAFLILAVLGSIFFGIATPTEASGVGAAGALLLAVINQRLNMEVLRESLFQTTKTSAFIFAIFVGATAFSVVLRGLGGDTVIEEALLGLNMPPMGVLAVVLFAVFLLGFFLDWVEITLIILPLVAPIMESLGFDLVWFAILFAVCLQTSFLTPPVGFALFYIKGVCPPEIKVTDIYKGVAPFILLQLVALLIILMWPPIVTWLPSVAY